MACGMTPRENSAVQSRHEEAQDTSSDGVYSRRDFLRRSLIAATAMGVLGYGSVADAGDEPQKKEEIGDEKEKPNVKPLWSWRTLVNSNKRNLKRAGQNKNNYLQTMAETGLMTVIQRKIGPWCKKINIRTGNRAIESDHLEYLRREHPALFYLSVIAVAPPLEEWIFRLHPTAHLIPEGYHGNAWGLGLLTSIGFAAAHNFKMDFDKQDVRIEFALDSVPVHQFVAGMYLWYLMQNRGYLHAVLSHTQYNATWSVMSILRNRRMEDAEGVN